MIALKHAVYINGMTDVAITKLDVLDGEKKVSVLVGYKLRGKEINYFPGYIEDVNKLKPIFKELPGWNNSAGITKWKDLPKNAQKYIEFIEKKIGIKVSYISTGPNRKETIKRT